MEFDPKHILYGLCFIQCGEVSLYVSCFIIVLLDEVENVKLSFMQLDLNVSSRLGCVGIN